MHTRVGTSGYSYKEWKGPFYPEKLAAKDMLAWYAERLPAVEINNTFYRMPKREVLESWAEQVRDGFKFSIKASRRITHQKRLKEADEPLGFLVGNLDALRDRLGVVLFQLPPNLKLDLERLQRFQALLPMDLPVAFEFRHESWADESVFSALRDEGHGIVVSDTVEEPAEALLATASHAYLRLRRPDYERADLATWASRLRSAELDEAFVFFKHEDDGAGPKMAAEFLAVSERGQRRRGAKASKASDRAADELPAAKRDAG
jgi:uncharacterized protein YecE (DUF72 family)